MYTREDITEYHCPRWSELPDIELYMDQVLSFIEKNTAVFCEDSEEVSITKTMINNYVKQKKVKPPVNKRYDRDHLAFFMVVAILKRFLSLSEISNGIGYVRRKFTAQQAYDIFCEIFEYSLRSAFTGEDIPEGRRDDIPIELGLYYAMTGAYANMLYGRYLLSQAYTADGDAADESK